MVLIIGAILCLIGFSFLVIKGMEYLASHQPPTICVKSHAVDNSGYKYGFTIQGKFGFGYVIDQQEICDKSIPNPNYKGKK